MHTVDVEFGVAGNTIPADHAYVLYGAIARAIPAIHAPEKAADVSNLDERIQHVSIHPINGRLCGGRKLAISRASRLRLRIPAERIAEVLLLSGMTLTLGSDVITVGVVSIRPLSPLPNLRSRLVTIKNHQAPETFLLAAQEQLRTMRIQGMASLISRTNGHSHEGSSGDLGERCPYIRRTVRISDKEIVGFALRVTGLSAEESLDLQEKGLGGRRRMGCGIFVPERD